MEHHDHGPWVRAITGGLCVLVGQSMILLHRPPTGGFVACGIGLIVVGGVLIISVLLSGSGLTRSR